MLVDFSYNKMFSFFISLNLIPINIKLRIYLKNRISFNTLLNTYFEHYFNMKYMSF